MNNWMRIMLIGLMIAVFTGAVSMGWYALADPDDERRGVEISEKLPVHR
jgi:hypothetical protein